MPGEGFNLVGPDGKRVHVSDENLASAIDAGYSLETEGQGLERAAGQGRADLQEEKFGGIVGTIGATAAGLARGASFGGVDVLAGAIGGDVLRDELAGLKAAHPIASTVGEVGGAVIPALGSAGTGVAGSIARATPAGFAAEVGGGIIARGAERGLAARTAAAVVGGAAEGTAQNLGMYASEVALGNKKLSAEGAVGAGLDGAMWGGGAAGVLSVSEKGFRSARKLFADADVTPAVVKQAETAATNAVDGALTDAGQASDVLKSKARMVRKARAEADPAVAAHETQVRAERLAQEQAKTAGAENLARNRGAAADITEHKLGALKAKSPPGAAADAVQAAEPAATTAIDDSLEGLLAQTSKGLDSGESIGALNARGRTPAADEAIESALDDAAAAADPDVAHFVGLQRRLDSARAEVDGSVQGWIKSVRKKAGGGAFETPVREGVEHARVSRTQKFFDDAGNEISTPAPRPDASAQWDRPRPLEPDEVARELGASGPVRRTGGDTVASRTREDYDTLIKRAARTGEGAERDALIKQASELESRAFDVSSPDVRDAAIGARWREGTSGPDLARRRVAREVADLDKAAKRGVLSPGESATGGLLGASDDIGDLESMIASFRKYEDVEREVVKTLGHEAPPGMAQRAGAHEQALAARQEAEMATATQQAENVAKSSGSDEAAGIVSRAGETAPGGDAAQALDAISPGAAPAEASSGMGSMLADAATAYEVMQSLGGGLGMPRIEHIPVIGPLLGWVLKARAAQRALGLGGGKIARTAEGEIAKRAAATRNRIRKAVGNMLDAGAAVVSKAQKPAPLAAVLAGRLFEGGAPPKRRKAEEPETDTGRLFAKRADEIIRSQAPGAIATAVNHRLNVSDPEIRQSIIEVTSRKMSFLASKLPGGGMLQSPLPSNDPPWEPDRATMETFGRYVEAANDPGGVLERALDGHLSLEGVETLQAVYPELFADAQMALLERATQITEALPYRRKLELSTLFKVPLDGTMAPDYLVAMQQGYQQQAPPQPGPQSQPPTPSITAPVTLGQRSQLPSDRISQR